MKNHDEKITLLPVEPSNAFLGHSLQSTAAQIADNLTLSVPEAIQEAFKITCAAPYFICCNDEVIGYTALVFDEEIPEPEKRYWLWQLMIDQRYQGNGYASQALEQIIEHQFKRKKVQMITLSTKPDNHRALQLYQKFGFVETGEKNGDEILLQKDLGTFYPK
ncbi:GNAT family N-acetyltransferase [Enterococcus sp. LJL98]